MQSTKHDNKKPRLSIAPFKAIGKVIEVMEFGAIKYDAHNFRKGTNSTRYPDAAIRHILAYLGGEDIDPESGKHHLDHASASLLIERENQINGTSVDDRYYKLKK